MMESKIRLNLVVPGATMLSSQDCEKMSPSDAYDHKALLVETYSKKDGKQKEVYHIYTRKSKPARQVIAIPKEGYDYMVTTPPNPKFNKKIRIKKPQGEAIVSLWDNMSYKDRLKAHFDLIAQSLGASSYTFELLED